MQYVIHTPLLLAFLSLALFSSCERKAAEETSKIKFEFAPAPMSAAKASESVSSNSFSGGAASSIADISCFVVFVGGPDLKANTCQVNTDNGVIQQQSGVVAGGILRGTSVEVSVPSGNDRVVTLIGFRTTEAGYCPPLKDFDKTKMSDPYVLGEAGALKLEPGATQEVPINMVLNTNKYVKDCSGPAFNFSGGSGGGLQEPDQISTYLPFGSSHISQNMCFAFPIELKKAGSFAQTATAKTVTVNKVSSGSLMGTTFAGSGSTGAADGSLPTSTFNQPAGLAIASNGDVYVADTGNHTIRKISSGTVSTIAGLAGTQGSVDGTGSAARFNVPMGIALDANEQFLFVADSQNHQIRKINLSTLAVSTLFLNPPSSGYQEGGGTGVRFNTPTSLVVSGNDLYVADSVNHRVRKIDISGQTVALLAGSGAGTETDGNGSSATFFTPYGITRDNSGNLYVTDKYGFTVRKIDSSANVTTIAGIPSSSGTTNGTALASQFNQPKSIVFDASQNALLVADTNNQMIRKISSGNVSTYAGIAGSVGTVNSTALASTFSYPSALAINSSGYLLIADTSNNVIRKVAPNSSVTDMRFYNTLAGCNSSTVGDETTSYTIPAGQGRIIGYFKSSSVAATSENFSFSDPNSQMTSSNSNGYIVQSAPGASPNQLKSVTTAINFTDYHCSEVYVYGYHTSFLTTANVSSTNLVITPSYAPSLGTTSITFSSDCSSNTAVSSVTIPIGQRFTTLGIWTSQITSSFSGTVTLTPSGLFATPVYNITVSH